LSNGFNTTEAVGDGLEDAILVEGGVEGSVGLDADDVTAKIFGVAGVAANEIFSSDE